MQPNKFDKDGSCLVTGQGAEDQLKKIAESLKIKIEKSNRKDDMYQHFDYLIHFPEGPKKVEVKARKKLSRKGEQQDEWIWIEFKNVSGNPGWIYGLSGFNCFRNVG